MHQVNRFISRYFWICSTFVLSAATTAQAGKDFRQVHPQWKDLFVWTDVANVYVLRSGNSCILFNLGDGSVFDSLQDIGVEQIDSILLTDHHRENCQGFTELDLRETKVLASEVETEILENPSAFRKWHPKLGDKYSVYGASYVRPPCSPIPVSRSLRNGEVIDWSGHQIQCISTPGTAPGSMTFLLRNKEIHCGISGSLIHEGAKITNWFDTEWDYGFGKGLDAMIQSIHELKNENLHLLLPSHGSIIPSATKTLQQYEDKLIEFRKLYIRGYPVYDKSIALRDPVSQSTPIPHINQVTPHLFKLSHLHQGRNFCILISDRGHGLVLDCGLFPAEILEEIILGLREHFGLKKIDAFWISHMHGDHFLLGPTLKERYGAQAWTLDRIVDRCEQPRRYDYAALVSAYGDGFDGMLIDKAFRDGETIQWEDYTIQVDWMPGQTEFGCCLWLDIDGKRVAFTGDNLFGSPSDPSQTGHEAVVCRNSCILEEGYILGSDYLRKLKPDIVMGSHSYVMPNPEAFLERYHQWSLEMASSFRSMLPEKHYEYHFDPYWVSAYPYRVDLSEESCSEVTISVRNFRETTQQHRIDFLLPDGVSATPSSVTGEVAANSRREYRVVLRRTETIKKNGVQIIPMDITLDQQKKGQLFDFLIRLPETQ